MKKFIIISSLIFILFSNIFSMSFSFKKNGSADVTPILIKYYKANNDININSLKKRQAALYNQVKNNYSSEYYMKKILSKYEDRYEKILKNNMNKEYVIKDTFNNNDRSQKYRVNRNSLMYKMYLFHLAIGNEKGKKIEKNDIFGNHTIEIIDIKDKNIKNKIFKDNQLIRKIAYLKMIEDLKNKTDIKYYYENIDNYDKIDPNDKLAKVSDKILRKKQLSGFVRAYGQESNKGKYKLRNLFIINKNIENIVLILKDLNKNDFVKINKRFKNRYILGKIKEEIKNIKPDNVEKENIIELYEKSPKITRTQFLYIKFDTRKAAENYKKRINNVEDYDRIAKKLLNRVEFTPYLEKNTHQSYNKFAKYVGMKADTVLPILKFSEKFIIPKVSKTKKEYVLNYQNYKRNYVETLKKEKYITNILSDNKSKKILTNGEIEKLKNYLE